MNNITSSQLTAIQPPFSPQGCYRKKVRFSINHTGLSNSLGAPRWDGFFQWEKNVTVTEVGPGMAEDI